MTRPLTATANTHPEHTEERTMSKTMRTTLVAAVLTAGLALSGCSNGTNTAPNNATAGPSSSPNAAPAAQPHNQADIEFAQGMIPHHAQAIDMAKQAAEQASSPQVKDLAGRIQAAQQPEIEQLSGFLRAWGAPVPDTNDSAMGGMNHGGMGGNQGGHGSMPGMMTPDQMGQLENAHGAAFDRMFLQMMIEHHQGAISMANTELTRGQSPEAKQLAQRIISDQQSEITEMNNILAG